MDGDGDLDLALAKGRHWPLHDRVLLNNGKGEFTVARNLGETHTHRMSLQVLGCVGVAPPGRDVVRTADSGIFGGNMDYNQIREGTTIYLPVFHDGALLFVGGRPRGAG